MSAVDYGYGDGAPSSASDYGYGDATPDSGKDYGYGDGAPESAEYSYGDGAPKSGTEYGHGDGTPDAKDYGYGDGAPRSTKDDGYGDAAPDRDKHGYGDEALNDADEYDYGNSSRVVNKEYKDTEKRPPGRRPPARTYSADEGMQKRRQARGERQRYRRRNSVTKYSIKTIERVRKKFDEHENMINEFQNSTISGGLDSSGDLSPHTFATSSSDKVSNSPNNNLDSSAIARKKIRKNSKRLLRLGRKREKGESNQSR